MFSMYYYANIMYNMHIYKIHFDINHFSLAYLFSWRYSIGCVEYRKPLFERGLHIMANEKVILAYSGGLDTTAMIP